MSDPLRVQMSGPLSVFAAGFRDELEGRGYRPDTVAKQLQLMAHLSQWLAAHELELAALDSVRIAKFVAERRMSHTHLASVRGLQVLLGHLRALGVVPVEGSRDAPTPAGELLDRYGDYLRLRRGLNVSTIRNYTNHARDFLADPSGCSANSRWRRWTSPRSTTTCCANPAASASPRPEPPLARCGHFSGSFTWRA